MVGCQQWLAAMTVYCVCVKTSSSCQKEQGRLPPDTTTTMAQTHKARAGTDRDHSRHTNKQTKLLSLLPSQHYQSHGYGLSALSNNRSHHDKEAQSCLQETCPKHILLLPRHTHCHHRNTSILNTQPPLSACCTCVLPAVRGPRVLHTSSTPLPCTAL